MSVSPGSRSNPLDSQPRDPARLAPSDFKIVAQIDQASRFDTFIGLINKTGNGAWASTPVRSRREHAAVKVFAG
jgi:hypothetical protein